MLSHIAIADLHLLSYNALVLVLSISLNNETYSAESGCLEASRSRGYTRNLETPILI